MSLSLPQALPTALPLPSAGPIPALFPAAPGTPAPGIPAGAGFFLALQQTALPALWAATPPQAGAPPATLALPVTLPGTVAEPPPSDLLTEAPEDNPPAAEVPTPALPAPLFAPIAATPAFQPHGLALPHAGAPRNVASTTAPAAAAPSMPAVALAIPGTAPTTAQDALPSFATTVLQATVPQAQPSLPVAALQQAAAPQVAVPAGAPTAATATAAPLEKALAASVATSREAPLVAWNPATADGLPAPLSTPPAVAPAGNDGAPAPALVEALGERIQWQLRRGSERAQIRLDPPMQGQLEITVRRDGAGLQIHLSATHSDVVRQLHAISDSLRGDLATRQAGDVTVTIAQHAPREQDGRGRQAQDNAPEPQGPGRALADAERDHAPQAFALSTSQG
ncbi:flagellar hook-length control protein FliK [Acidovorax sp.]|uniref:flagellar hook-length control protein FliK n=1 Tax=Acidovorax sp. TaxID=1872122 RepID=UPI002ACD5607|nr:flagellar hook-length control protein FliK [Acidovorax sp.]MDZ7862153.1 flagellar hook-length control protein FliK [Acidovorax sp.]